jgi:hypothetical protein
MMLRLTGQHQAHSGFNPMPDFPSRAGPPCSPFGVGVAVKPVAAAGGAVILKIGKAGHQIALFELLSLNGHVLLESIR